MNWFDIWRQTLNKAWESDLGGLDFLGFNFIFH